jgi:hypothetical protein
MLQGLPRSGTDTLDAVELQRQRESIRRALLRTNMAAGLILLVLIGLALAATLQANRAVQQRARAVRAEQDARDKLWSAYERQARGTRAALLRPTLDLRNDAILSLTTADLRLAQSLPRVPCPALSLHSSGDEGLHRWQVGWTGTSLAVSEPEQLEARGIRDRAAISRDGSLLAYGCAGQIYMHSPVSTAQIWRVEV